MLHNEGWQVNHKRIERIWRAQGLKVPMHEQHSAPETYWFSVDGFAVGTAVPAPPTVFTEGAFGPAFEAASDVFAELGVGVAPSPPIVGLASNTGKIDGNGFLSASAT